MIRSLLLITSLILLSSSILADDCDEGVAAHDAMDFGAAVAAFTHCIDEAGEASAPLLHKRGRAHMKAGDNDAALIDFTAAIGVDENYAPAWNSRAWVYYMEGDLEAAAGDIEKAVALDPKSARAHDTRAHILAAQGHHEDAIAAFERGMVYQTPEGVAKIQRKLKAQGIDPGPVDGVYGPKTRAALEACARAGCNLWGPAK